MNSCNHSGKLRNLFPGAGTMFLFVFLLLVFVGSRDWYPDAGMLVSSLRDVAGLDEVSDVSYGNDVEDVLALELEEPVDEPGTTIGTSSVLHRILLPFLVNCGF